MTRQRTRHERTEITATGTDRVAYIDRVGNYPEIAVYFGRLERGEYVAVHAKPSRLYKTPAGARRAADRWVEHRK